MLCGAGDYLAAVLGTALAVLVLELDEIPALRRLEARRLRDARDRDAKPDG